jgi:hypothetical protein
LAFNQEFQNITSYSRLLQLPQRKIKSIKTVFLMNESKKIKRIIIIFAKEPKK